MLEDLLKENELILGYSEVQKAFKEVHMNIALFNTERLLSLIGMMCDEESYSVPGIVKDRDQLANDGNGLVTTYRASPYSMPGSDGKVLFIEDIVKQYLSALLSGIKVSYKHFVHRTRAHEKDATIASRDALYAGADNFIVSMAVGEKRGIHPFWMEERKIASAKAVLEEIDLLRMRESEIEEGEIRDYTRYLEDAGLWLSKESSWTKKNLEKLVSFLKEPIRMDEVAPIYSRTNEKARSVFERERASLSSEVERTFVQPKSHTEIPMLVATLQGLLIPGRLECAKVLGLDYSDMDSRIRRLSETAAEYERGFSRISQISDEIGSLRLELSRYGLSPERNDQAMGLYVKARSIASTPRGFPLVDAEYDAMEKGLRDKAEDLLDQLIRAIDNSMKRGGKDAIRMYEKVNEVKDISGKISQALAESEDSLADHWNNRYPKAEITYRARDGNSWDVRNFITPDDCILKKLVSDRRLKGKDHSETAMACMRWVQDNIRYISDEAVSEFPEEWLFPSETLQRGGGDCEDGTNLLVSLMRNAGVPAFRVKNACGEVPEGGHSWPIYLREKDNSWVILDWCYKPSRAHPDERPSAKDEKDYKIEFTFNDQYSWSSEKRDIGKRSDRAFSLPLYVATLGMPKNHRFYKMRDVLCCDNGEADSGERFDSFARELHKVDVRTRSDFEYLAKIASGMNDAMRFPEEDFDMGKARLAYSKIQEKLNGFTSQDPKAGRNIFYRSQR